MPGILESNKEDYYAMLPCEGSEVSKERWEEL